MLQFGEPRRVVTDPGLNVKIPFIQNVEYVDKRLLHLDSPRFEAIASDQKRLVVDAYLRYRLVDPLLFHQSVRTQVSADARLQTILESALREALGTAPLIDIVSGQRELLMQRATEATDAQARNFGIEIEDRAREAHRPARREQPSDLCRDARGTRARGPRVPRTGRRGGPADPRPR